MRGNFGHKLLAVGDNDRAARLSGIDTDRVRITAFVLSATSAVIAGHPARRLRRRLGPGRHRARVRGDHRGRARRRGARRRQRLGDSGDGRRARARGPIHPAQPERRVGRSRGRCPGRNHHRGRCGRVIPAQGDLSRVHRTKEEVKPMRKRWHLTRSRNVAGRGRGCSRSWLAACGTDDSDSDRERDREEATANADDEAVTRSATGVLRPGGARRAARTTQRRARGLRCR